MKNALLALALICASLTAAFSPALAQNPEDVDPQIILNDPASPTGGNPKGDVTIVAFFDYNCPYCRKADRVIEQLVKKDGNIRLVYKDLPILSEASVHGAHLALAAGYQGKYAAANKALMSMSDPRASKETMRKAVAASGVDMARLDRDLATHGTTINAYLRRNLDQARAMGLRGTPVYLIGPYMVPAALDYEGYAQVVKDARAGGR